MATDSVGQTGPPLVYTTEVAEPIVDTYTDPARNGKPQRGTLRALPVWRREPVVTDSAPPVVVTTQAPGFQLTGTQILIGVVILALLLKGK